MATITNTISTLINTQVPSFVRDDHPKFVSFLKAYYKWLESSSDGKVLYYNKQFRDISDIDKTLEEFIEYFKNNYLFYFPKDILLDERKLIKHITDLYTRKGSEESYKLLFRILYNKEIDLYYPKKDILIASHGKWTLPQAVRLTASDELFALDTDLLIKRKLIGETSRSTSIIEGAYKTVDKDSGRQILEIFISNLTRLFDVAEYAIIEYVDSDGVTRTIREKIIGAISNLRINPQRRGKNYRGVEIDLDTNAISYPGDPVVFYGGLSDMPDAIKAEAYVNNVTVGGIETISVIDGGQGYRTYSNTLVTTLTPTQGHGANIVVLTTDTGNSINVVVNTDAIEFKKDLEIQAADYGFENITISTISTTLGEAFAFSNVSVAPLNFVTIRTSGAGFRSPPQIEFETFYGSDLVLDEDFMLEIGTTPAQGPNLKSLYFSTSPPTFYVGSYILILRKSSRATREVRKIVSAEVAEDGSVLVVVDRDFSDLILDNVTFYVENRPRMKDLGLVANVKIISGGTGYAINEPILFNSTTSIGYGAAGRVSEVGPVGEITDIEVTESGEGYYQAPEVFVETVAGANAILIAGIMSNNEEAFASVGGNGEIKDFRIVQRGFDYIATPNVSLKIRDVYVDANDVIDKIVVPGERVWQNVGGTTLFTALIDFYRESDSMLRIYNYSGALNANSTLETANDVPSSNISFNVLKHPNTQPRIITYGDGKARANAEFLNGLIRYNGYYLNSDGFLSSDKKLQGPRKYHNFSYVIGVEQALEDYKDAVISLLHPAGVSLFGQYNLNNNLDLRAKILSSNVSILSPLTGNVSGSGSSNTLTGSGTSFTSVARANDIILIDSGNSNREQSKYIMNVVSDTELVLESNLSFIGFGRANVTPNTNTITIYSTTLQLSSFLEVGDSVSINVSNTSNSSNNLIVTKTIENINEITKRISFDSDFEGLSGNGKIYLVEPTYSEVSYKIVPN
jgi:hypothetical protein